MPKKLIEFLEKNVEWFALGLGALWLAYVAYGYWLTPPATQELRAAPGTPAATVTPATIDATIAKGPIEKLRRGMEDGRALPAPDKNIIPDSVAPFRRDFPARTAVSPYINLSFVPPKLVDTGANPTVGENSGGPTTTVVPKTTIARLPKVPAPTFLHIFVGRAVIAKQAAGAAPGGAAAGGNVVKEDRDWTKIFLRWDVQAFMDEMTKAKIPADLQRVLVARVEVEREEKLPDGKWGNGAKVANVVLPANVVPAPAPPAANVQALNDWMANLARDQERVLRPQFYDVVMGDKDPQSVQDAGGRLPAPPVAPAPAGPGPGAPAVVPGALYKAPNPPIAPIPSPDEVNQVMAQVRPRVNNPHDADLPPRELPGPGPVVGPGPGSGGVGPGPGPGPGVAVPAIPPAKAALDEFWVHDETLQEGKTYRYRVRVIIVNPLVNQPVEKVSAADAKVVELPAGANEGWSEWSSESKVVKEVKVPTKTKFYVVSGPMVHPQTGKVTRNSAKFQVYTWTQGKWTKSEQEAGPGDPIGTTGWSVVDIRPARDGLGRDDWQVILMDDRFQQDVRSMSQDNKDKGQMAAMAAPVGGPGPAGP